MKNTNKIKFQIIIASVLGALSIILGAFSAHALENFTHQNIITQHHLNIFEKAVKYQMYHAIVILILALFNFFQNKIIFQKSIVILLSGILFFSGSLYWIALQNIINIKFPAYLFWITPLGGLLMITGWLSIIYETFKHTKN